MAGERVQDSGSEVERYVDNAERRAESRRQWSALGYEFAEGKVLDG